MYRKFASLKHSAEFAYCYNTDTGYSERNVQIERRFRMFQTYGDGLTAHSHDWPITREYFADYLASLAAAMLADQEMASDVQFTLARGPSKDAFEFAASIKFKESDDGYNKRRYFSMSERKVSAAPAKEHDKRYQRIESWCDGSAKAIYRMTMTSQYPDGIECYVAAEDLFAWAQTQERAYCNYQVYCNYPAEFLEWFKDDAEACRLGYSSVRDRAIELQRHFQLCRSICESYRLRAYAEGAVENIRLKIARDAMPPPFTVNPAEEGRAS